MAFLVNEKNGRFYTKNVELLCDPKMLRCVCGIAGWNILKALSEKPSYPCEIAKKLKIGEQIAYYYIRQMEKSGIIKIHSKSERKGALAKYYVPTASAFAIELPFGDEELAEFPMKRESKKLAGFMYPFVASGKLDACVVVGSPDPHGLHQVRARDGHYGIDLAILLGQLSAMPDEFVTRLDIDIRAENRYNNNLIIVGGILTNVITAEVNKYLPVRFDTETFPFRKIVSEQTGKSYTEDNCGFIAKIPSPFDKEKHIMVIAGNRYGGTKAAVLGLTRHYETVLEKYGGEDNWGCVVQGLDVDGDGKIDSVKVLEP